MTSLDGVEFDRWVTAAREELEAARHNADGGFHNVAVLHAEQSAQCSVKALLHGVGAADRAYGHGLLSLADRAAELAGMDHDEDLRSRLGDLAREYLPSRYPDALPEGTPRSHYSAAAAQRAIVTAEDALASVRSAWQALQAADVDPVGEEDEDDR